MKQLLLGVAIEVGRVVPGDVAEPLSRLNVLHELGHQLSHAVLRREGQQNVAALVPVTGRCPCQQLRIDRDVLWFLINPREVDRRPHQDVLPLTV